MNRQDLINTARLQLGLSNLAPSDWTYAQRVEYNKLLASLIAQNADSFPPQEVAIARQIEQQSYDPLADNSVLDDLRVFGSAFVDELGKTADSVADIGRGIRDTVSLTGKALPYIAAVALVGVALYFVIKYDPRRNA
jgi:hypothetical protein